MEFFRFYYGNRYSQSNYNLNCFISIYMMIYLFFIILLRYNLFDFFMDVWANNKLKNTIGIVLVFLGVQLLVLSFFHRWIFSFMLIAYSVFLTLTLKVPSDQVGIIFIYSVDKATQNYHKFSGMGRNI